MTRTLAHLPATALVALLLLGLPLMADASCRDEAKATYLSCVQAAASADAVRECKGSYRTTRKYVCARGVCGTSSSGNVTLVRICREN